MAQAPVDVDFQLNRCVCIEKCGERSRDTARGFHSSWSGIDIWLVVVQVQQTVRELETTINKRHGGFAINIIIIDTAVAVHVRYILSVANTKLLYSELFYLIQLGKVNGR